jgi:hypothetical protein
MKQGINLGPPQSRSKHLVAAMVIAAGAGALVLGALYTRARADVAALAIEVGRLEEALSKAPGASSPEEARFVAARLRLALDSRASSSIPPTALLRLVESALPEGVVLGRISFNATPSPSLTLEATAPGGDRVTDLQRRLAASPWVSTTSLLEERRLPEGRLALRVQVGLEPQ